jgi:type I restriction enzyme S subunit
MVPEGWRKVALGEVAVRVTRRNTTNNDNVLTISARDGLVSQEQYFNKRVASRDVGNYFNLKRGEFAYSKSFSQGYPAGAIKRLVKHDEGVVSPLYMCFALPEGKGVVPDFAARYLESDPFYRPLRAIAKQGARAHGLLNVRPEDFFSIPILLPPLDEQRRIAAVLQAADDAVDAAEAVIEQTEKVKRGLVEQLLTRGMPGRHTRFKITEIGEVPESWEVVRIGDVLESTTYGISTALDSDAAGIPVLRMGNIQNHRLDLSSLKYASPDQVDVDAARLRRDDIVFNRTNSMDLVGKVALVDVDRPLSFASYLLRLRTNRRARPAWLHLALSSGQMQTTLQSIATRGVSQCNINPSRMRNVLLMLPPLGEQDELASIARAVDGALTAEADALHASVRIRSGLAQDLLSGRVRVPL